MRTKVITRCILICLLMIGVIAAMPLQAESACQASGSIPMFPDTATTCDTALTIGQTKDILVTVSNTSTTTPAPGTPVSAALTGTVTLTLACTDTSCVTQLPGTVTFVPVGGNGCVSSDAGVASCAIGSDANHVLITMTGAGVALAAGALNHPVATIRVQGTSPVMVNTCGQYGETAATGPQDIVTTDTTTCGGTALGGAQGSTFEFFPPPPPTITLTKECTATFNSGTQSVDVAFSGVLTNTGTFEAINGITCSDVPDTTLSGVPTSLDPGASATITGTYNNGTSLDASDVLTCSGTGAITSAPVSADAPATCSANTNPSISLTKACTATFNSGTQSVDVSFSGVLTNTGNETIGSITCSDVPDTALTGVPTSLDPGASATITGTYNNGTSLTANDTLSCSGTGVVSSAPVSADAPATCSANTNPSISLTKECTATFNTGTQSVDVAFTAVLTNTGDETIGSISCSDVPAATLSGVPSSLDPGASATITGTYNNGSSLDASDVLTCNGTGVVSSAPVSADAPATCSTTAPCQVQITKMVAPDDGSGLGTACDGVPDGPFVKSVTVDPNACVVYQICVTNTGQQVLDTNGVTISDDHLGIVNADFGEIGIGDTVCKLVPSEITTATQCPNGACVCQTVEGTNTAVVSSAVCQATGDNACDQTGSICEDTANVACTTEVGCRMTGGHNNSVSSVDAEYDGSNGQSYTTGGQIGAPTNVGCCDSPQKGKCVDGVCTGGLNAGNACTTNTDCPNNAGHGSTCPWGEWEHTHHAGPDDSFIASGGTTGIADGSFSFHSGTASAPDGAFIQDIICADPGWCVQARPAPVKQIFWEGTGVFQNMKGKKNIDVPLPYFEACGTNQPVPWTKKAKGTIVYYRAHVADFGEPAGQNQKPSDSSTCTWSDTSSTGQCEGGTGTGGVSISGCELVDGYCPYAPAPKDDKFTALHPLCEAQDCGCGGSDDPSCQNNKSGCPDFYEIEIHCTADPASPIAYKVAHFITQGNFQLHPAVGSSCQPCGDGICQPEYDENCVSCPEDCGLCPQ